MSGLAVTDDMIGDRAYAVNLIASPSAEVRKDIGAVQDLIVGCVPADSLYKCPAHSLHMSVFQFVHSRKGDSSYQIAIWDKYSKAIDMHLKALVSKSEACVLKSGTVYVIESAVIIQFATSHVIEALRDQLEAMVYNFELSWNRPTIQHATIYRYVKPFQLSQLANRINEIEWPNLQWRIDGLNLVQEEIYPALEKKIVQCYKLG